eukprot:SAG25_NODE_2511_length_1559_cov_1.945205_1_plen_93_part_10
MVMITSPPLVVRLLVRREGDETLNYGGATPKTPSRWLGLLGDVRKTDLLRPRRGCSGVVRAPVGLIRLAHPFAAWANTRMKRPGRRGGHSLGK